MDIITLEDIKKLRKLTGAGLLSCKKALKESNSVDEAREKLEKEEISKYYPKIVCIHNEKS